MGILLITLLMLPAGVTDLLHPSKSAWHYKLGLLNGCSVTTNQQPFWLKADHHALINPMRTLSPIRNTPLVIFLYKEALSAS